MRTSHARTAGLLAVTLAGLLALGACQGGDRTTVQPPVTTVADGAGSTVTEDGSSVPETTEFAATETSGDGESLPTDGLAGTTEAPATTLRSTATTAVGSVTVTVDPAVEQAIASMSSLLSATDDDLAKAAAGAANGG